MVGVVKGDALTRVVNLVVSDTPGTALSKKCYNTYYYNSSVVGAIVIPNQLHHFILLFSLPFAHHYVMLLDSLYQFSAIKCSTNLFSCNSSQFVYSISTVLMLLLLLDCTDLTTLSRLY